MNGKSSVYPAITIASLLGLAVLAIAAMQFSISVEPATTSVPATATLPTTPTAQPITTANSQSKPATNSIPGALKMSNQTDVPVRVALLARGKGAVEPAHWDFAPQEGSKEGLVLSLPEGNFKLKKGDILVAFAQDGSGYYWGPYVVGESDAPVWDKKLSQWQLTLQ